MVYEAVDIWSISTYADKLRRGRDLLSRPRSDTLERYPEIYSEERVSSIFRQSSNPASSPRA